MYHLRAPQRIPLVISTDEAKRLLAVAENLKARVMLSLSYGCGLRAGEGVRLKVKQIDSAQKIIRVEQSKGRKDRNVMLSPEMLDLLRQWWKVRPSRYDGETPLQERCLFPGSKGRRAGKPITTRHLNRLFHEAARAAGIRSRRRSVTRNKKRNPVMITLRVQMLTPVSAKCSWNRRISSNVAVSGDRFRNAANRLQLRMWPLCVPAQSLRAFISSIIR